MQPGQTTVKDRLPFDWLPKAVFEYLCLGKKFLIFNMVARNLKVKYHRSVLGLFWTLLAPLAMAFTYFFVFRVVMRVQVPNYLVFILSGLLPWTFFSQTMLEGMESIVGNVGLITKIPVPLQIFPFVGALTNLITLVLALPILLGAALLYHVPFGPHFALVLYYFTGLFLLAYAFGLILSSAFIFFRDLRHLMGIIMQLWFFGTPVIYDETMLPAKLHFVVHLNPVGDIFCGLHTVLAKGIWPSQFSLLVSLFWITFMTTLTIVIMRKLVHGVVELI